MDSIVITISLTGYGKRGPLFSATVGGRVVVASSGTPFLDAARVLASEGVDAATRIVMRREEEDHDALVSTVGHAAKLTVYDDGTGKPVFSGWKPRPQDGVSAAAGVSPVRETAPPLPTSQEART